MSDGVSKHLFLLYGVIISCAILFVTFPAYADEAVFETAILDVAAGHVSIYAAHDIDGTLIYTTRLYVSDLNDTVRLPLDDFARLHSDTVLSFRINPDVSTAILQMHSPYIHAKPAAITTMDGIKSGNQTIPIVINGTIGDVPKAPAILASAMYSGDDRTLKIQLTDKIELPQTVLPKMIIRDDYCGVVRLDESSFRYDDNKNILEFKIGDAYHDTMRIMVNPYLYAEFGTFVVSPVGLRSAEDSVPLDTSNMPSTPKPTLKPLGLQPGAQCEFTYTIGDPSVVLESGDYNHDALETLVQDAIDAVHKGLDSWAQLNPGISFSYITTGTPSIAVDWIEHNPDHVGLGCLDCLLYGATILVALEAPDCHGDMVAYDQRALIHTVAHEFGHNLGLEHHPSNGHLMWTPADDAQVPYDDLGYVIPELDDGSVVGAEEMLAEYDKLDLELSEYKRELAQLDRQIRDAESQDRYGHANSLIYSYNGVVQRYNTIVNQMNQIADDINCLLDVS